MTNQSIKNAFQRFWEYVVSKVDGKQDIITGTPGDFVVIGDNGNVTTLTDEVLSVKNGGTGATNAANARTNLGFSSETWTFTLEDGSTVTKTVMLT